MTGRVNSFQGTVMEVGNTAVRSVIDEIIHFRTQVTRKSEMRQIDGWSDTLNELLGDGLERINATLSLVTRDQLPVQSQGSSSVASSDGQDERQQVAEEDAANENLSLRESYNKGMPIAADNVQMPASHRNPLPYTFDGSDPDIPQLIGPRFKNVFLKQFVSGLDITVRDLSGLACAPGGNIIPRDQSAMIHARLNQAYTILQTKGGNSNRPKVADGTDPNDMTGKVGPEVVEPPQPTT